MRPNIRTQLENIVLEISQASKTTLSKCPKRLHRPGKTPTLSTKSGVVSQRGNGRERLPWSDLIPSDLHILRPFEISRPCKSDYMVRLQVMEDTFIDQIVFRHLIPPLIPSTDPKRNDIKPWEVIKLLDVIRPWDVHGYEEYESALVDEVFDAEASSRSSNPHQRPFTQSRASANKTQSKKELDATLEVIKSSSVKHNVELDDIAFMTEVMKNAEVTREKQLRVLNLVQGVLKTKYGPKYRVESFGSSRYGIGTLTSDLDMVILDPTMKDGLKPGTSPSSKKLYDVRRLQRWLNNGGFKVLKTIPNASVPIVKFLHRRSGVDCDICVNERLGLLNTELLATYCRITPLLRPMLLFIKLWAKPRGLNDSASTAKGHPSFSSYALALMTITFLQTRGLLPNLQADLPPLNPIIPGTTYWTRRGQKVVQCDVRYHSEIEGWEPKSRPSLREVLIDYFTFWGKEFKYVDKFVSMRHGRILDVQECDIPRRRSQIIAVLDPFIVDKNVTQIITRLILKYFLMECRDAASSLKEEKTFRQLTVVPLTYKNRQIKEVQQHETMERLQNMVDGDKVS